MQRMDFEMLVQTRKSVRGFKKQPINGEGAMRSDIVREIANIPQEEVIMTCVAMGYPDDSFPANSVRSDREANGDFVRYVGFAD